MEAAGFDVEGGLGTSTTLILPHTILELPLEDDILVNNVPPLPAPAPAPAPAPEPVPANNNNAEALGDEPVMAHHERFYMDHLRNFQYPYAPSPDEEVPVDYHDDEYLTDEEDVPLDDDDDEYLTDEEDAPLDDDNDEYVTDEEENTVLASTSAGASAPSLDEGAPVDDDEYVTDEEENTVLASTYAGESPPSLDEDVAVDNEYVTDEEEENAVLASTSAGPSKRRRTGEQEVLDQKLAGKAVSEESPELPGIELPHTKEMLESRLSKRYVSTFSSPESTSTDGSGALDIITPAVEPLFVVSTDSKAVGVGEEQAQGVGEEQAHLDM